jgi:hypothetical protein
MALAALSIFERRRDQMFPELDPFEIERMRRFGEARSFAQGEAIFTIGEEMPMDLTALLLFQIQFGASRPEQTGSLPALLDRNR